MPPLPELLAGTLAFWFILDAILTHQVLTKRSGREANKVLNFLFMRFDMDDVLAMSKFVAIVVVWYFTAAGDFNGVWGIRVLIALHVLYGGVVCWNAWQFVKKAKQ